MAGDKTGIGKGGKIDGYGHKVRGQEMASRAMARGREGSATTGDSTTQWRRRYPIVAIGETHGRSLPDSNESSETLRTSPTFIIGLSFSPPRTPIKIEYNPRRPSIWAIVRQVRTLGYQVHVGTV